MGVFEHLKKIVSPEQFEGLKEEIKKELVGDCWIKPGEQCSLNQLGDFSPHCASCNVLLTQLGKLNLLEFISEKELKKLKDEALDEALEELENKLKQRFSKMLDEYSDNLSRNGEQEKVDAILKLIDDDDVLKALAIKIIKDLIERGDFNLFKNFNLKK